MSHDKVEARIDKWVRPEIRALSAYHVPDPGKMIKLDAMENPYHWPEEMVNEFASWLTAKDNVNELFNKFKKEKGL